MVFYYLLIYMETKKCNGIFCCGEQRPLDEFDVVKGKVRFQCRKCIKEKKRIEGALYRENNKEKIDTKNALYRENNREKAKIYATLHKENIQMKQKSYREKNKEKLKIQKALYKKNNKEKIKIVGALYYKNNREREKIKRQIYNKNNKEKINATQKEYYQNNKQKIHDKKQIDLKNQEKYIKHLIYKLRATDKKHNRDCDIDCEYITDLIKKQNNKCIYSNAHLKWAHKSGIYQGSVDRINPLEGHIKGNCQLVTVYINYFKNNLMHDKFMELIHLIKDSKNNNEDTTNEIVNYTDLPLKTKNKVIAMFEGMKNRELIRRQKNRTNELIANGYNKKEAHEQAKKEITKNNINFEIDFNFFDELRRKCNDRCALTSIKLTWKPHCINTGSIDRINPEKGYEKDNIQITSWYVNFMKNNLPNDVAKQILEQIIAHNSKENNLNENNSENSSEENNSENSSEENNSENSSENSSENNNLENSLEDIII